MAVQIPFEGIGDSLLETLRQAADATANLRKNVTETNEAQVKGTQKSVEALGQYVQTTENAIGAVVELNKQTNAGGTAKLSSDLSKAADASERLDTSISETGAHIKAAGVSAQPLTAAIDASRQRAIALLNGIKSIPAEQRKIITAAIQGANSIEQIDAVVKELASDTKAPVENVKNLRQQFLEAKNEATLMIAKFGEFSPEAIEATNRAAQLKDQLGDFNKRLDALNPDAKFAAFGTVLSSVAGGFTALQGAAALFGAENEDIQKGILKLQAALGITQGLQAFFGGFKDGLKDIRALLGLTTAAQVANTAASEADIVAKGEQSVAIAAVGSASTGATAAFRAMTAAFIANPIGIIIAAFAVLAATIYTVATAEDSALVNAQALLDKLKEVEDVDFGNAEAAKRLGLLQNETDAIKAGNTAHAERAKIIADAQTEELERQDKLLTIEKERAATAAAIIPLLEKQEEGDLSDKQFEDLRNLQKKEEELNDAREDIRLARIEGEKKLGNDLDKFDGDQKKQSLDRAKKLADDERRIREQLVSELINLQTQLSNKVQQLEEQTADPNRKLELQRQAGEKEIELLRQNLLRKQALIEIEKKLGAEAFNELSEAQKQAQADALIGSGDIQLATQQEQQLHAASLLLWKKYYEDVADLAAENNKTRLALLTDEGEVQRKQFELDLNAQVENLRKAGATEDELREFRRRKSAEFANQEAQRVTSEEEKIALARFDAIVAGGAQTEAALNAANIKRKEIEIEFAKQHLEDIQANGSKATQAEIEQAKTAVAVLTGELNNLKSQVPKVDIFELLGFEFTEADKQRVTEGLSQVFDLITQSIAFQQQEVDAQISATDQIIADRERRTQDLNQRLNQEIELAKLGLANNVQLVQDQIAENERQAQQEKARKQQLLAEKKKLAQQELAIDAVVQVSKLVTTGVNIFAAESIKGIPGAIAAIGFVASVIAAFASFRARAKAIASGGGPSFEKGGGIGLLSGPRHAQGGIGLYNEGTGERIGEAEGGEAYIHFIKRQNAKKAIPFLEAINENNIAKVADLAIAELMRSNGIQLEQEKVKEFVDMRHTYETSTTIIQQVENEKLRKDVQALTRVVRGFQDQQAVANDTSTTIGPDGTVIRETPTVRRVRRKARTGG